MTQRSKHRPAVADAVMRLLLLFVSGLAVLAAISILSAVMTAILYGMATSDHFFAYAGVLFIGIFIAVLTVSWKFRFFSRSLTKSALDVAFLIAGLTALVGLINVQTDTLTQLREAIEKDRSISKDQVSYNLTNDEQIECNSKPTRWCSIYAQAKDLADDPRTTVSQWLEFRIKVARELNFTDADVTAAGSLAKFLQGRKDFDEHERKLVDAVYRIPSDQARRDRLDNTLSSLLYIEHQFEQLRPFATVFGLCFSVVAFSLAIVRLGIEQGRK